MPILFNNSTPNKLLDDGPMVVVEIFQPLQLVPQNQTPPTPFIGKFLIDTGARSTVIKPHIAKQLGLKQISTTTVGTPNQTSSGHPVYVAGLKIMAGNEMVSFDSVRVVELPLAGQNIDGLIGRDILVNKQFIYIGFTGMFTLST